MATCKLTVSYDGTDFSGWQAQPGQRTVQGVVAQAWQAVTGEAIRLTAASRTDAGVHAVGQVVGVETGCKLPAAQLLRALNARLPEDVLVSAVDEVPSGFHATHDPVGKRYRYQIHNEPGRPLFDRRFVWHVPQALDVYAMQQAAAGLRGRHDFASFQSAGSERTSTVRTLFDIDVLRAGEVAPSRVWIEVEGDGFLYNMVRVIVGTLVEVGLGRQEKSWPAEVLAATDRRAAGRTAPPQGLVLLRVDYPSV